MKEGRQIGAGIVLFFLSPVVAELLTSSSPPVSFFTPVGLLTMSALYGSGAIIARELTLRWHKSWPTLIALGAAYGIIEEGLMIRSFFDPNWPGIGLLGHYGRAAGVNWVWSVELMIFHALFSIVIPNILVNLIFPAAKGRRVTGEPGFFILCAVLLADAIFGGLALNRYAPPVVPFILSALCAAGLVVGARFLPQSLVHRSLVPHKHQGTAAPLPFFVLGLAVTVLFFVLCWVVPGLPVAPIVTILLIIYATVGLFIGVWQLARAYSLCDLNLWGLVSGALAFFVVLAPLIEMDPKRANLQGMSYVGLGMAVFLVMVFFLVRGRRAPVS